MKKELTSLIGVTFEVVYFPRNKTQKLTLKKKKKRLHIKKKILSKILSLSFNIRNDNRRIFHCNFFLLTTTDLQVNKLGVENRKDKMRN